MTNARNKRSLTIARHRTSVSLEEPFWTALADIAKQDGKSVAGLVREIDTGRGEARVRGDGGTDNDSTVSLSAAIRLYVLERARGKQES
ncbi:MAG TPA: ribbon-helix-helix domain-containing protein [Methyloceanibacter sp.]|nr:ribbon-helix-helix domain-containing protein [Methyloceanibacter sp.]